MADDPKNPPKPPAKAGDAAAPAATDDAPKTFSPYSAPGEMAVPGGLYRRHTRRQGDKDMGGDVADANGVVLATFETTDKDGKVVLMENTGDPRDGELTDHGDKWDGKKWVKVHGDKFDKLPA